MHGPQVRGRTIPEGGRQTLVIIIGGLNGLTGGTALEVFGPSEQQHGCPPFQAPRRAPVLRMFGPAAALSRYPESAIHLHKAVISASLSGHTQLCAGLIDSSMAA